MHSAVIATLVFLSSVSFEVPVPGTRPACDQRGSPVLIDDSDVVARNLATRAADAVSEKRNQPKLTLKSSLAGITPPASPAEFRQAWHFEPVLQGLTGNCWAYASTSFFESEIQRLSGRQIKLSEMHTVYWEYVEKARRFVQQRGNSEFPRGSQPNATLRIWSKYGVVPAAAYTGLPGGREFHADRQMHLEMRASLETAAQRNDWNEEKILKGIRNILNRYLGPPPGRVKTDTGWMTPREYLDRVVRLNMKDYVSVCSFLQQPRYEWCEYDFPDNWWQSREYFNVPLDDFARIVREAVSSGQTVCMGIDDGEPGYLSHENVAFVPSFDIPAALIDDAARQLRFNNESTTDDHIVHLVGVHAATPAAPDPWYLIKDSATTPRNGPHGGYVFYHEDYIRMKTLCLMLPRQTVERVLGRAVR